MMAGGPVDIRTVFDAPALSIRLARRCALVVFVSAMFPAFVAAGETITCCKLPSGERLCADTLPAACRGHAYEVKDNYGNVLKRIKPAIKAVEESSADRRRRQLAELRRNRALLETYPTLEALEKSQSDRLETLKNNITNTEKAMARAERGKIELTGKPDAQSLIGEYNKAINSHRLMLSAQNKKYNQVKERLDEERERYLRLTNQ